MNPQDPNNLPSTYVDPYALANSQPVYSPQAEQQPYVEQAYVQEPYQQSMAQQTYAQQPVGLPQQAQAWQDQSSAYASQYTSNQVAMPPASNGNNKVAVLAIIIAVAALIISTTLSTLAFMQANKKVPTSSGATGQTTQPTSDESTDLDSGSGDSAAASNKFPESSRQAFLSACVSSGGTDTACSCVLTGLEERLTFEQFKEADAQITATGQSPDYFSDAQSDALQSCS